MCVYEMCARDEMTGERLPRVCGLRWREDVRRAGSVGAWGLDSRLVSDMGINEMVRRVINVVG